MKSFFKTNLKILRKRNPELHDALDQFKPNGNSKVIPTLSGYPTLLWLSAVNDATFLHSPEDPIQEAEKLLEGFEFNGEDITILFGFGLGYIPQAIYKKMHSDHQLFVVEARLESLTHACREMDLSSLLADERIQIFSIHKPHLLLKALEKEQFRVLGSRIGKIIHPPSFSLDSVEYQDLEKRIEQFVAALQNNYLTLDHHGELTARNIIENLQSLPDSAPIDSLFDIAPGKPALVVAAGPSLDKNIAQIRGYEEGLSIIAVDTALKPLMAEGLTPHFVVSVDPIRANLKKFEQIPSEILDSLPLVFSPYVLPIIPQRFNGPKFVFNEHNRLSQWALNLWYRLSTFPYGFSVAHYAFYLARAIGADPIIFIGLDLAFSDNRSHAANSADVWGKDSTKEDYPQIIDIYGNRVSTHHGFISMISLFEQEIAQTDSVCIDATEGGALIRGMQVISLKQALQENSGQKIPDLSPLLYKQWSENRLPQPGKIQKGLEWIFCEANQVSQLCNDALSLLDPLVNGFNTDVHQNAQNEIAEINATADRMSMHQSFKEVVKDRLARVLVTQFKLKYQMQRVKDEKERLWMDLQQSHLFFTQMDRVSRQIIQSVEPVKNRFDSMMKNA